MYLIYSSLSKAKTHGGLRKWSRKESGCGLARPSAPRCGVRQVLETRRPGDGSSQALIQLHSLQFSVERRQLDIQKIKVRVRLKEERVKKEGRRRAGSADLLLRDLTSISEKCLQHVQRERELKIFTAHLLKYASDMTQKNYERKQIQE